ncbi:MAG: hypothetical protein JWM89_3528 [Acidimicrobiales bacterium]|nr:hypothetical protein [Acidimicrobiales bacterium]
MTPKSPKSAMSPMSPMSPDRGPNDGEGWMGGLVPTTRLVDGRATTSRSGR